MKYLRHFQVMAAVFALALSFASNGAQAVDALTPQVTAEKHKVVFQVSAGDPKIWNLALNNAKNVQQELGAKNVDVEIVVYGPGIGMLKFDSAVANRIDEAVKKIMAVIQKTCQNRGLTFETKLRSDTPPVLLSKEMVHLIDKAAREKKFIPLKMTSGALHDSSIIAEVTEVGMIFVPSKDGRSHCPEEFTDSKDIHIGAEILLATVLRLST